MHGRLSCAAGTVVDSGVCHPTEFDFYLLSHAGETYSLRMFSPNAGHALLCDLNCFVALTSIQLIRNVPSPE